MIKFKINGTPDFSDWNLSYSDVYNSDGVCAPTEIITEFLNCAEIVTDSTLTISKLGEGLKLRSYIESDDYNENTGFFDIDVNEVINDDIGESVSHVVTHLNEGIHNDVEWALKRLKAMRDDFTELTRRIDRGIESICKAESIYNEQIKEGEQ